MSDPCLLQSHGIYSKPAELLLILTIVCMRSASPVSSERMAAILARAKERQKQRQSKLNATPESAADMNGDGDKAQVVSKASSTGKNSE